MATVDELFAQAMTLSAAEREELANRLYQSTLPEVPGEEISPEEAERYHIEEIKRRLAQFDRGEVKARDWNEVMDELRAKYPPAG
jgi:putative addiction module component (TIGR02574 family)